MFGDHYLINLYICMYIYIYIYKIYIMLFILYYINTLRKDLMAPIVTES